MAEHLLPLPMRKPGQNLPWPMARFHGLSGIFNIVSENPLGGRAPSLAVTLCSENCLHIIERKRPMGSRGQPAILRNRRAQ